MTFAGVCLVESFPPNMSHISTPGSTAFAPHHLFQQLYCSLSDMQPNYSPFTPIGQSSEDNMQSYYASIPLDPTQFYGAQGQHSSYGEVQVDQRIPPEISPHRSLSWVPTMQQTPQGLVPDYIQQAPNEYMLPSSHYTERRHSPPNPYPRSRDVPPDVYHPTERSFYSGPNVGPPRLRNPHACEKCRIRKAKVCESWVRQDVELTFWYCSAVVDNLANVAWSKVSSASITPSDGDTEGYPISHRPRRPRLKMHAKNNIIIQ